ncbi:3-hydroxy-3-methylglutaryl-CoA reductase [Vibrio sp. 10N.286.49.C2]|uniref:hydroxymethylglutaryl-CoA reductase n=1 Tax=unclassified Vibrio TaxID=2614977 RepID=UPI000C862AFF|nr:MULTISPECIES: hydroxymethylglutaryl-CoA reductase [unclassified Vibrio]PMH38244.1 3-hydroxy-3-methylglutaryl-CoA reductase [Vibrio sp. 10N.286.49.C2]PMH55652.1 3-hydroxy-3-methylglutaryl-CoA reductase [Vibrio sp. 10N.286.49.B1]PMH82560.1 3-hydroxy-3-methylglutaryl-CoA reductase [Vibrio sp. 10N.286.48.B7]
MPKINLHKRDYLDNITQDAALSELQDKLAPKTHSPSQRVNRSPNLTQRHVDYRWKQLDNDEAKQQLLDPHTMSQMLSYNKNIEFFIGTLKMPIGTAGPLRVNGLFANGDYQVPLATTEAALVASYNRGANLITASGGASAMLLNEGVTRTPGFAFQSLIEAGQFVAWVVTQFDDFKILAESTTSHGKLIDINVNIEGNHVYLVFEYLTGDASGQNMVTIATNCVFEFILAHSPIQPEYAFLDANLSGDKKANSQTLRSVRGKKVTAEVTIAAELIEKYLHTTPKKMSEFAQMTTVGGALSGTIGINAHYANALAALYIACGQDAACVAESAIGMTRMELTANGDLYASVTMPNIMVGTVGGGTGLPSQRACLELLGLHGSGKSQAFAEVTAVLCLAGELSIVGAFCAGHFSQAHHKLAR